MASNRADAEPELFASPCPEVTFRKQPAIASDVVVPWQLGGASPKPGFFCKKLGFFLEWGWSGRISEKGSCG